MWPFGRSGITRSLAGIEEPTEVELLVTIVSPDRVMSPVTGVRAAILHAEILEEMTEDEARRRMVRPRGGALASLGEAIYGDLITCHDEGKTEISFVARRARFRFPSTPRASRPVDAIPPDLVPLMSSPRGGPLAYREHAVREGELLRIQAIVEPTRNAMTLGYRSAPRFAFVARDDLAPVFLAAARD